VPSAEEFRSVADVLLDRVPAETDISSVGLGFPDGHWLVRVRTRTPGRVIGRRGATADALRSALAEKLGDPGLRLNIEEAGGPGEPPPGPPPAGDREPRRPTPTAPRTDSEARRRNG
jgi:predicted RNA-binding protein YlqC (UPF0109 family)